MIGKMGKGSVVDGAGPEQVTPVGDAAAAVGEAGNLGRVGWMMMATGNMGEGEGSLARLVAEEST